MYQSQHHGKNEKGVVGKASWLSGVVNLLNTIVGAGVLAMPKALSNMGILLGSLIILWAGLTAGFGLYLQTRCARYLDRGTSSYFALSQITYPNAAIIFDAAIAIKCFGVGVSYLIIIGDLMPGVVQGLTGDDPNVADFLLDRHFWITAFMLIVIPFSFLRRLDSLKYTSFIALVSIGYLLILVIAHYGNGDTLHDRGNVRILTWKGFVPTLSSFPVMVFAYTCHQNMFSILNEMRDPRPQKTTSVVTASTGTAATIYLIVAITGYLSFGDNIVGNIVAQYVPSVASTIGKAAIVVLVMFSYPLQVHPCRASVDSILKWRPQRTASSTQGRSSSPSGQRTTSDGTPLLTHTTSTGHHHPRSHVKGGPLSPRATDAMSETRFAIISTAIIVLSYTVAMTVSSLEAVLAYVGSTGSTSISFILPGLFFYKISAPDSPYEQRLLKADDEEESAGSGSSGTAVGSEEDEGGGGGVARRVRSSSPSGQLWGKTALRRLSLALAIYGMIIMVVCLATNTFFLAVSH